MVTRFVRKPGSAAARRVGLWCGVLGAVALLTLARGAGEQAAAWRMAAVAVLMACWWVSEALPLAATGLVPVVAFPLLDIMPVAKVSREYGHHLILLFLAGFLLALALGRWGLDRRLALGIVAVMGDRTRVIIFGLMAATALLSMWVSNSATAAMMMPVGLALTEHAAAAAGGLEGVDVAPGRFRFGVAVMLGIAYAASIGGVGTLVGTPPNVLLAAMLEDLAGVHVGFGQWMLIGIPVVLLTLPLVWWWLVRVAYPPEIDRLPGGRRLVREELRRLGPWTPGARRTAAIVILTAVAWVTRELWQPWVAAEGMLKDATVGVAGALALFLTPSGDGGRLLERDAWREVPWNVLLLFGGGLALARGFVDTGLARLLSEVAVTLAEMPLPVFLLAIGVVVVILTEFASNTASTAMVLPLLAAAAASLGLAPPLLMVPAALAASMAFMMPAGTPPNAIVFGTGYVRIPQMLWGGVVADLVALVVITAVTLLLVPLLF